MGRLSVFNNVTLDGYFTSANNDMSWAHAAGADPEWQAFTNENASGTSVLMFGRKTYDMMAGFWPTPAAAQAMPKVAESMNRQRKVVVSRTMATADWANTEVLNGDIVAATRKLKAEPADIVILGSGEIVSRLTEAGLVDEFQLAVHPIVLGAGRTLFETVKTPVRLKLEKTRQFGNGAAVLWYAAG